MRSIIGNKLASLYQLTKQNRICWILCTNLQKKTQGHTDEAIPFARLQKSEHRYIVSKSFSRLETS